MTVRLFIFGLGYVAGALADAVRGDGGHVSATRRAESIPGGTATGLFAYDGGDLPDAAWAELDAATHLLISIPPGAKGDAQGDPALATLDAAGASLGALEWVGYLSTTGVYGDTGGAWVDETSPPAPGSPRAARRVAAEAGWTRWAKERQQVAHHFRLAGIYGPGRNPLEQLRAGTARRLHKPGQVFSRTHVDDIVQVLRASMARPDPAGKGEGADEGIYNVCDDLPAPSPDVIAYAAELLGIEPPPLVPIEEADLSPMAASFYAECRRVRNDRIKTRLGVALRYPTYREGLQALAVSAT